jgi:sulfur carrier protein
MLVKLNGTETEIPEGTTVTALLERLDLSGRIAVEINQSIVSRRDFDARILAPGDTIEIVHAIGGG